jgi:hypothetical protein
LEQWGVHTIACDLLDPQAVEKLPDAGQVVFMGGMKFGASDSPALTWAMNCQVPAHVSRRYAGAPLAAFSTGNVYGLSPSTGHGSPVGEPPAPVGEYAMSALGRERIFQYFSETNQSPLVLLRLNYATELRYGVLVDLAEAVREGHPVDVSMGYVNVIWLADANAMALRSLEFASHPFRVFNVAGPDVLRVRDVCRRFGEMLGVEPRFVGQEADDALLNDGREAYEAIGLPQMAVARMIEWTADWVARGGESLGKPTHFGVRDGKF